MTPVPSTPKGSADQKMTPVSNSPNNSNANNSNNNANKKDSKEDAAAAAIQAGRLSSKDRNDEELWTRKRKNFWIYFSFVIQAGEVVKKERNSNSKARHCSMLQCRWSTTKKKLEYVAAVVLAAAFLSNFVLHPQYSRLTD